MNLLENGEVIVGFRPEHLVPAALAPSAPIKITMKIHNVEYLGSEWIIYGRAEAGPTPDKIIISRLPNAELSIGGTHEFAVAEPHLRFFDKASEKRTTARALSWP
jgi:multiple sugar transport system ATP-binding protein